MRKASIFGPRHLPAPYCLVLGPMEKEGTGLLVYKFGGASVKDAASILNLKHVVETTAQGRQLLIVVSAMGKTTNALEEIFSLAYNGRDYSVQVSNLRDYHEQAFHELDRTLNLMQSAREGFDALFDIDCRFGELISDLNLQQGAEYDERYDQIISQGEGCAADLVVAALAASATLGTVKRAWARQAIRTNDTWREGRVDWAETQRLTQEEIGGHFAAGAQIVVTEGFIGGTADSRTTTLGREGSDYSAAIFAYCLRAESVTIWKDVPGLLNADPKIFADTVLYPEISYQETIEMAYYGASVIHPKTLKPLADRHIPLLVKSFLDPTAPGTRIHDCQHPPLAPAFIRKTGQYLVSLESKDFAFISEENLEVIFGALAQARLKINLMQNSALSFSVCLDGEPARLAQAVAALRVQFRVQYNEGLTLFTIKNYTPASVAQLTAGRTVLLEQRTRSTFQVVVLE